ncbi:hypothetical protein B0T14DRAFT_249446 [Immersiella caudata]|uniref:BZIP domain-containing protein n=1 Tax=Immersiella caudata TaxID=314043 RepID=A0AA39WJI0_9PEZI|nr:hypothetical protein B0T14DRAFT_249446 [Immersiella caudata]
MERLEDILLEYLANEQKDTNVNHPTGSCGCGDELLPVFNQEPPAPPSYSDPATFAHHMLGVSPPLLDDNPWFLTHWVDFSVIPTSSNSFDAYTHSLGATDISSFPGSLSLPSPTATSPFFPGPVTPPLLTPPVKRKRGRPRRYDCQNTIPEPSSIRSPTYPNTRTATPPPNRTSRTKHGAREAQSDAKRLRNRNAAQRYRGKLQESISQLQVEEREASAMHLALRAEAARLRTELFKLKNEVFRHVDCDCLYIQRYLRHAVCQSRETTQWSGIC